MAYTITKNGWIGVDLDGSLAYYEGWQGPGHIGDPIPEMKERVENWLKAGWEVRIVTARATDPEQIPLVQEWLVRHGLPNLVVTNMKDYGMVQLWDDRAVQLIPNTGMPAVELEIRGLNSESVPEAKHLADEVKDILTMIESDDYWIGEFPVRILKKVKNFLNQRATEDSSLGE